MSLCLKQRNSSIDESTSNSRMKWEMNQQIEASFAVIKTFLLSLKMNKELKQSSLFIHFSAFQLTVFKVK